MSGLILHNSSDSQLRIHLRVEDEGLAAIYVEYAAPEQLKAQNLGGNGWKRMHER